MNVDVQIPSELITKLGGSDRNMLEGSELKGKQSARFYQTYRLGSMKILRVFGV